MSILFCGNLKSLIGKCQSSVVMYDGSRLQIHYFVLHLSGFIVLHVKFFFVLWIFCLVSFNELTFPDSQDWLSVMKLASIRRGGDRRETGMEMECVCEGKQTFRTFFIELQRQRQLRLELTSVLTYTVFLK